MKHDIDTRRKRLRYRASHTGTKETDLLLGGFIDAHGHALSAAQIGDIEALLDQARDLDLLNWISGRERAPSELDTETLALIARYATERHRP